MVDAYIENRRRRADYKEKKSSALVVSSGRYVRMQTVRSQILQSPKAMHIHLRTLIYVSYNVLQFAERCVKITFVLILSYIDCQLVFESP